MEAETATEVIYDDGLTPEIRESLQEQGVYCPEIDYNKIVEDAEKLDQEEGEALREKAKEEVQENFHDMITKENEFMELFPPGDEKYYLAAPYRGHLVPLRVKPLTTEKDMDSELLEVDNTLFSDINEEDRTVLTKYNSKEKLNRNEKAILKKIQDLEKKQSKKNFERMNKVLAQHVIEFGPEGSYYNDFDKKDRLKFWEKGAGAEFLFKMNLFMEVMDVIGATQTDMFKLFRVH